MTPRIKTKFKWNKADVVAKVDKARLRGLRLAGAECRKQITRSMSNRKERAKPQFWPLSGSYGLTREVKLKNGQKFTVSSNAVAAVYRVPKPDKVTSWKGGMSPKGYLRQSIEYDYDRGSDSVVVGPATKKAWLNELHEFGGSDHFYVVPINPPVGTPKKYRNSTIVTFTTDTKMGAVSYGQRQIKARPFVGPGMQKAIPKVPAMFRNQIKMG